MSPFDEGVFDKPLDAQVKAETEESVPISWTSRKLQRIGCVFRQAVEAGKACCGLKKS
jgi:hypothetical protein